MIRYPKQLTDIWSIILHHWFFTLVARFFGLCSYIHSTIMHTCYFLLSERVCDSQISYFLLPRRWLIRRAWYIKVLSLHSRFIYSLLLMQLKEIECTLHLKLRILHATAIYYICLTRTNN